MTKMLRLPGLPRLLALAIATLGAAETSLAADLRQRLNVRQEASEVVLGETMHSYYMGDSFAALSNLLVAKAMGRIDENVATSELLIGDLYTAFGMPEEADTVFARVATQNLRSATRNETVFRQGRLQYRQGNYFEAERILNMPLDIKMSPLETERRVMLANVLMTRNAFVEARDVLAPIPLDNPLGPYATYNIGVSHLRANHDAEGKFLLEKVMNLPVSDSETNALKDRAALALGYDYLQMQQPDKAREALVNVRLKGPFSNNAILALGWANYERKDYKRALNYWLELLTRNTADPLVQEAMLLAPRAYEALQANQQALYGYKLAASTLTGQLDILEKLENDITTPGWLDHLTPPMPVGYADPLGAPESVTPLDPVALAQLYSLFISHPFNEGYQQYDQLKRLRRLLDQRSSDLRALRSQIAELRRRQTELPALAARVKATRQRLTEVSDYYPILDKRARQAARGGSPRPASPANLQTMEQQFKLQQIENALKKQPDSPAVRELRNRLAVLKGLVLMSNVKKVAPSQDEIYADLSRSSAQLNLLQLRMEAVQHLLADRQTLTEAGAGAEARITAMESRLQAAYRDLDQSLAEYREYLNQLAISQLEDRRNRINSDIAEAHLSIARLQDASLFQNDSQGPAPAKPTP
jgi:tetratricopeptide (TPR) repeat protein